jgi:hypothetical protein
LVKKLLRSLLDPLNEPMDGSASVFTMVVCYLRRGSEFITARIEPCSRHVEFKSVFVPFRAPRAKEKCKLPFFVDWYNIIDFHLRILRRISLRNTRKIRKRHPFGFNLDGVYLHVIASRLPRFCSPTDPTPSLPGPKTKVKKISGRSLSMASSRSFSALIRHLYSSRQPKNNATGNGASRSTTYHAHESDVC